MQEMWALFAVYQARFMTSNLAGQTSIDEEGRGEQRGWGMDVRYMADREMMMMRKSQAGPPGRGRGQGYGTPLRYPRALVRACLRAVGLSAVALFLLSACSTAGTRPASLTPKQALLAASTRASRLTSASEDVIIRNSSTQGGTVTGTIQIQRTPLKVSESLAITRAGTKVQVKAIFIGNVLFFSEPALKKQIGKPWIKLNLSTVDSTPLAELAPLLRSLGDNSVTNQAQLFAAAENVHVVGRQAVAGVPTTEYAGSFYAARLLKTLRPGLSKALASVLKTMGNGFVIFRTWIDGQHQTRKMTEIVRTNGPTTSLTVNVTSVNQPVQIAPPPASQTFTPPGT